MRKGRKIVFVLLLVGRVSVCIHYCSEMEYFSLRRQGPLARKQKFPHAISEHYRDFEHAYVYWIWLGGSASYAINGDRVFLSCLGQKFVCRFYLFSPRKQPSFFTPDPSGVARRATLCGGLYLYFLKGKLQMPQISSILAGPQHRELHSLLFAINYDFSFYWNFL